MTDLRDAVAEALVDHELDVNGTGGMQLHGPYCCADAVLPLLAARIETARAEALNEAADELPGFDSIRTHGDAAAWLRARAGAVARDEGGTA